MESDKIPTCNKGTDHESQPIIMICLNKDCETKRLCCLVCVDQLHQKHQLVSIKKFQQMILGNIFFNCSNPKKKAILNVLQQYESELYQAIDQLRNGVLQQLQTAKEKIRVKFATIYETFQLQTTHKIDMIPKLTNQTICDYFEKIKEMDDQKFVSIQQTTSKIEDINKSLQKVYSEVEKRLKSGTDFLSQNIDKIKLGSKADSRLMLRRFSSQNKAACLVLTEDNMEVQRGQGAGGYPICLLDQPLNEVYDSASFKLVQQPGNVACWIGIACLEIVKTHNFQSCYGLGKGTYAIDQVGVNNSVAYSWSHHDMNYNSKPIVGWTFDQGDIITVRIDFTNSCVIFSKGLNTYQQPIKLNIGKFYAFAGPTGINDKWQVIN